MGITEVSECPLLSWILIHFTIPHSSTISSDFDVHLHMSSLLIHIYISSFWIIRSKNSYSDTNASGNYFFFVHDHW